MKLGRLAKLGRLDAGGIALLYSGAALVWILVSDWVTVHWVAPDHVAAVQTLKGSLYVAVTSVLLYWLVYWNNRDLQRQIAASRGTEEALRESESRLRRGVDNAPFPIMIHAEDGAVLMVNRAWKELTGYDDPSLRTVDDWIVRMNADNAEEVRDAIVELFEVTGPTPRGISNITCRDGSRRVWDFSASPLGTLADGRRLAMSIAADLTERMEASAARELLTAAIEQLGESVIITDADGTIEYVNSAFERITGYRRAEAIGGTPRILKSGAHDEVLYTELWSTIASGRTWQGRLTNRRKDGTEFTEETTISPVRDDNGAIRHYVAVKSDITGRLELEENLRQRSKMESIGRLAGGVAHDFNNMLTVILGHAELALEQAEEKTSLHDSLAEIQLAAERSGEMTRQLLAFARRQAARPTSVAPNERVEGMLRMLRRLIGEDIELVWRPGADLPPVDIDPGQFDQILANLCVNARDAIDGGGRISIETRRTVLDESYCRAHGHGRPGDYVQLVVSDDGRGMDRATMERAFEPYFTTKPTGKGTGLGLATVYGIVEQNDGFVRLYSEPGEGTTLRVYLPRSGEPEPAAVAATQMDTPQGAGRTVLLVEDEPRILELGTEMLRRLGYSVLPVDDPAAALRLAEEYAGTIDLLMTDVVMPGMNGRQLAERLQSLHPGMPCLYMSGYTADAMADRGVLEPGTHFLQKPFLLQDLAAGVRRAVDSQTGTPA